MSRFPSLPLFTDAFIADTGHLNATETGAYLMLLMMAWRSPGCKLPNNDDKLARWARVDPRTWARVKPAVMEFWTLTDGFWTQKRLASEHDKVSKHAETARQNGKHGGRPKALKTNGSGNPTGSAPGTQKKAPNPNPNPNPNQESLELSGSRGEPGPSRASARPPPEKGVRLPKDFILTPEMTAFAAKKGFSHGQAVELFEQFCDHWWSSDRPSAIKCDWLAAWRTWVRKAASGFGNSGGTHANGNGQSPPSRIGAMQRAAARFVN